MASAAASPAPDPSAGSPLQSLLDEQIREVQTALLELSRDPEKFVHDARVALRKLRSSLTVYAPLLAADSTRSLRRELSWLAGALGPARDAQVMLARIRRAVDESPDPEGTAAMVLKVFEERSEQAFARARESLASERFVALVGRLDVAGRRSQVVTDAPPSGLAIQDLGRLLRDLEATEGASDVRLHELRKAVKRARYVRGSHDKVDAGLKRVQAALGEHQDSVVARERLTQLPLVRLVESLLAREEEAAQASQEQLRVALRKLRRTLS